jgi:lysophospholipase L1-like esterase
LTQPMRRFLFWYLPVGVAIVATCIFAYGFQLVFQQPGTVVVASSSVQPRPRVNGKLRIVVLGDSVARGTGDETGEGISGAVEKELDRRRIAHEESVNLAVNGAKTGDLLRQLESPSIRRFVAEADIVVLSIGGNDLFGGAEMRRSDAPPNPVAAMDRVEGSVAQVVATVRSLNPRGRIFFVGLYNPFVGSQFGALVNPAVAEWSARLTRRFASDPDLTVVQTADLFSHEDRLSPDRFHPGTEAYGIIGRRIGEAI